MKRKTRPKMSRETGSQVSTEDCPNCGTARPFQAHPDGSRSVAACSTCYGSREQATIASYEREFGVPDGVPLPEPPEDLEEE